MQLLIKFGRSRDHLIDFVKNGRIFINPVQYFSDCENEANGQFDRFENVDLYSHGRGAKITIAGREFNVASPFGVRDGTNEFSHVYCLYLLSEESISRQTNNKVYDEKLWSEFGEYIVAIHNAFGFCELLTKTLGDKGYSYRGDPVEYFDEVKYEGTAGPFKKRNNYQHQEEFRFAIKAPRVKGPISDLYLGSIEHLCYGPVHKSKCKNINHGNRIEL